MAAYNNIIGVGEKDMLTSATLPRQECDESFKLEPDKNKITLVL